MDMLDLISFVDMEHSSDILIYLGREINNKEKQEIDDMVEKAVSKMAYTDSLVDVIIEALTAMGYEPSYVDTWVTEVN